MIPSIILSALLVAAPARSHSPCEYGAATAIPANSSLADQLRCYQGVGRRVTIPGTTFTEGGATGGYCVKSVATDRFQVGRCTAFGDDVAITIPFTSVAYLTDRPDLEYVTISLHGSSS
jgi:hypothetical protein